MTDQPPHSPEPPSPGESALAAPDGGSQPHGPPPPAAGEQPLLPPYGVRPPLQGPERPSSLPPTGPTIPRPTLTRLRPAHALLAAAAGVGFDLGVRTEAASLAGALAVVFAAATTAIVVRTAGRVPQLFCAGAMVFGLLLPLRASTWLTALNGLMALACLGAAALTTDGELIPLRSWNIATRTARLFSAVWAPVIIAASARPDDAAGLRRWMPVLRGLTLAAVPVLVLGALLASADAVFASAITPGVDVGGLVGHGFVAFVGFAALVGLLAIATTQLDEPRTDVRPLGAVEALVVLGSVGLLYAGFAIVQLLSALGQADSLLAGEGVTYAEYARSGFFQLLWVAGLTAVLLATIRLFIRDADTALDRAARIVGAVVALLTCLIVATAIVRLRLYTAEFGQTTLRWYSTAFAWMLGIGFIAIATAHVSRLGRHLPATLLSLTAVTLIVCNLLNAEARVAEHNLGRDDAIDELDANYLIRLSADAWPALADNQELVLDRLQDEWGDTGGFDRFVDACDRADRDRGFGPAGFNLALARLDCAA